MSSAIQFCVALLILVPTSFFSYGQAAGDPEPKRARFLGFEASAARFEGESVENDYIRGQMADFRDYGGSTTLWSNLYKISTGVKIEKLKLRNKLGISTGIRFTQLYSSIERGGATNYFYFRYSQSNTTTDFLRIKRLDQTSGFLSVPLEIRYFPFKPRKISFYFMLGGELGYLVASKTGATFLDPAMEDYQDGVNRIVGPPNRLFGTFYGGGGLIFGKNGKPRISIGINAPMSIPKTSSSLCSHPNSQGLNFVGGGIQFQVQLPF